MLKNTPLKSLHTQLGAEFKEYHGWTMPHSYGELENELSGLRAHSAAFDLCAFSRIAVSGADAGNVIKLAFQEAGKLDDNSWSWAVNGKQIRIAKKNNDFIVLIHPQLSLQALKNIKKAAKGRNVNIDDQTDRTAMIGIYGPTAYDSLSRIVPLDISSLDEGMVMSVSVFMMTFTVIRGSWLGVDGVELICPVSASKFATQAIEKYHKREHIVPAGMLCFDKAFDKYVSRTA